MRARTLRRLVAVAGLSAWVVAAPAWAAGRDGRALRRGADFWGQARAFLGELWVVIGIAPPRGLRAASGEDGHMIDPDGLHATSPGPACSPAPGAAPCESVTGDSGLEIDPNG